MGRNLLSTKKTSKNNDNHNNNNNDYGNNNNNSILAGFVVSTNLIYTNSEYISQMSFETLQRKC